MSHSTFKVQFVNPEFDHDPIVTWTEDQSMARGFAQMGGYTVHEYTYSRVLTPEIARREQAEDRDAD